MRNLRNFFFRFEIRTHFSHTVGACVSLKSNDEGTRYTTSASRHLNTVVWSLLPLSSGGLIWWKNFLRGLTIRSINSPNVCLVILDRPLSQPYDYSSFSTLTFSLILPLRLNCP